MTAPFIPQEKDRLGADSGLGTTRNAATVTYPSLPDNESIIFLHWVTIRDPWNLTAGEYLPFRIRDSVTANESMNAYTQPGGVCLWTSHGGVSHFGPTHVISSPGTYFHAYILDRVNGNKEIWQDAALAMQTPTTQDPSLALTNFVYLNTAGGVISSRCIHWRADILTLANGLMPTESEWAMILRHMRDPDAPVHPLLAEMIGTRHSIYRCGEGLYGSAVLEDQGKTGADLAWQLGETVEDVRVRAVTPWRNPSVDWYTLIPGATATTGQVNFGFAVQLTVTRFSLSSINYLLGASYNVVAIRNNANTHGILVRKSGSDMRLFALVNAVWGDLCILRGDQLLGGDLFIVQNGVSWMAYLGGQHIATHTAAATLDLSGATIIAEANGLGQCCRIAAWNPATVPATLLDEIRRCVNNPEIDPPSLGRPLVDFPLNETTLPLVTSNAVVNQGSGGGTLTLSAQRSTSCKTMLWTPGAP